MAETFETTKNPLDSLVQAKNLAEFRRELETLALKVIPLLTEMAELSLVLIKKEPTKEAKAKAGAVFLKKALGIALERKEESDQKVVEYFSDVSSYFAFIVAAPFVIASEKYDNLYLRHYIDINAASKNPHEVVSEKRRKDYAEFEEKVRGETEKYMRGLLAEFMVFCCCQKAELNPKMVSPQQDVRGTDLSINLQQSKIPLQVKAENLGGLISCRYDWEGQKPNPKILVNLNVPPFYHKGEINTEGLWAMLTNQKIMAGFCHEMRIALKDWAETNKKIEIPPALMIKSLPKPAYA